MAGPFNGINRWISPYFAVIKPTLAADFDHRMLQWRDDAQQVAG